MTRRSPRSTIRPEPQIVTVRDGLDLPVIAAFRQLAARLQERHPILLKDLLVPSTDAQQDFLHTLLTAANESSARCCATASATPYWCKARKRRDRACGWPTIFSRRRVRASSRPITWRVRRCGRTLFNLQDTTAKIRAATGHLKGVKIAIMGCIVNGPGEMADADFGYVGGAPGKVNLYVGKQPVRFNIPEGEAVDRLTDLIREHGRWIDAVPVVALA